jgi:hypothetical protein
MRRWLSLRRGCERCGLRFGVDHRRSPTTEEASEPTLPVVLQARVRLDPTILALFHCAVPCYLDPDLSTRLLVSNIVTNNNQDGPLHRVLRRRAQAPH